MTGPSLTEWFYQARPKTLTAAVVPVILGHLIVASHTTAAVSLLPTIFALTCAVLIQIGTNFFNDVIDFQSGADGAKRTGPHRLLQQGKVSENRLRAAALSCFFAALIIGAPLVIKGGLIILLIGLISILIGYSYSAPPLKLAYRGIAEPFVVIFFGLIAVIGIEWIHNRSFSALGVLCGVQVGLLATALMVINNIRDYKQDLACGKKTSVARFGPAFGSLEVAAIYLATLMLGLLPTSRALPLHFFSYLWLLPAVLILKDLALKESGERLNRTLALAALAHFVFGAGKIIQIIFYNPV